MMVHYFMSHSRSVKSFKNMIIIVEIYIHGNFNNSVLLCTCKCNVCTWAMWIKAIMFCLWKCSVVFTLVYILQRILWWLAEHLYITNSAINNFSITLWWVFSWKENLNYTVNSCIDHLLYWMVKTWSPFRHCYMYNYQQ